MQIYDIKSLSQHFEKETYEYVNISMLTSVFKITYFEEQLRTAASGDVVMKLIKINIYS